MTNSAEIKAIHGAVIKGQPDPEIVSMLERLLEKAKAGDIRAMAYAAHDGDDLASFGWECGAFYHQLIASISLLQHAILSQRIDK